jgi:hypothetical protein
MGANRCDALGAGLLDAQQMTSIGMALPPFNLNDFARERVRDIDRSTRAVGNPIAAMAETLY